MVTPGTPPNGGRPPRLRPVTDVSPADWLVTGSMRDFDFLVGNLLPDRFEAYARLLHPAESPDGEPVTWAEIAEWSARTVHPLAQFEALAVPARGSKGDPGRGTVNGAAPADPADPPEPVPFDLPPDTGALAPGLLGALCDVLARHTGTPQRCWFCLWDGYAWIDGSGVLIVSIGPDDNDPPRGVHPPPAFPAEIINGPRVRLPNRDYILLTGPLSAATELGDQITEEWFDPQSPNLLWPDDRAWCVATEIDLDSTFIGGSAALIGDLLADPRFETLPAHPGNPITADSDQINGPSGT